MKIPNKIKMKIPKKVKVANHIFDIVIVNDQMKADRSHGSCSTSELLIRISDDYKDSHIKETLLHEIMHAIWWCYSIHNEDKEERTVTVISVGLAQVFQDNPDILKFFGET